MELIAFIVSGLILGTVKFVGKPDENKFLGSLVEGAFGGAIEEVLEGLIKLLPNGTWYFFKRKKRMKEMLSDINEYFSDLSPEDKASLVKYISDADFSNAFQTIKEKAHKYGITLDFEEFFQGFEKKSAKDRKVICGNILKVFEKVYKDVQKNQTADIVYFTPEVLARRLTGRDDAPASFIAILKIIDDNVFKIKYQKLGGDERDLAKVIQYMMQDCRLHLIDDLKEYFDAVLQTRAYAEAKTGQKDIPLVSIEKIAKKDPFCFVRLVCPECGASGSNVRRSGDRAVCICCGSVYDIVRNIDEDEITKKLALAEQRILEGIGNNANVTAELSAEVKALAGRVVTREYFEQYKQELAKQESKSEEEQKAFIAESIKLSEENILKALEPINGKLAALVDRKMDTAVESISAVLKEEYISIESSMKALTEGFDAFKGDIAILTDGMVRLIDDVEHIHSDTQTIIGMLENEGNRVPTGRYEAPVKFKGKCPRCGNDVTFKNSSQSGNYICPVCGYADSADSIEKGESVDTKTVDLKLYTDGSEMELDFKNDESYRKAESLSGKCGAVIRITVTSNEYLNLIAKDAVPHGGDLKAMALKPETVILDAESEVSLNGYAVSKLVNEYSDCIERIVLGGRIKLVNQGISEGWTLEKRYITTEGRK